MENPLWLFLDCKITRPLCCAFEALPSVATAQTSGLLLITVSQTYHVLPSAHHLCHPCFSAHLSIYVGLPQVINPPQKYPWIT